MQQRVGIVHPAEVVARGLVAGLGERGFEVHYPIKAAQWVLEAGDKVLLHVRRDHADIEAIADLQRTGRRLTIVALMGGDATHDYQQAFRAGCTGAISWEATLDEIMRVVEAAALGLSLIPGAVARHLADAAADRPPDTIWLTDTERIALRLLAEGAKTNQIADECGYSEREMFRMLGDVYARIGVSNRSQAIATAARWGLLDS